MRPFAFSRLYEKPKVVLSLYTDIRIRSVPRHHRIVTRDMEQRDQHTNPSPARFSYLLDPFFFFLLSENDTKKIKIKKEKPLTESYNQQVAIPNMAVLLYGYQRSHAS